MSSSTNTSNSPPLSPPKTAVSIVGNRTRSNSLLDHLISPVRKRFSSAASFSQYQHKSHDKAKLVFQSSPNLLSTEFLNNDNSTTSPSKSTITVPSTEFDKYTISTNENNNNIDLQQQQQPNINSFDNIDNEYNDQYKSIENNKTHSNSNSDNNNSNNGLIYRFIQYLKYGLPFGPIFLIQSLLIVSIIYGINSFLLKDLFSFYTLSFFVIYFVLYLCNYIYDKISGNKPSTPQTTLHHVHHHHHHHVEGSNNNHSKHNHNQQQHLSSHLPSPQGIDELSTVDIKAKINFYERSTGPTKSKGGNGNSSSPSNSTTTSPQSTNDSINNISNSVNGNSMNNNNNTFTNTSNTIVNNQNNNNNNNKSHSRSSSASAAISTSTTNISSSSFNYNQDNSFINGPTFSNHSSFISNNPLPIFYAFPTHPFTDIDQTSTYRTRNFGNSSSYRKSTPPEYYNQYLNFLSLHNNNGNNNNGLNNSSHNHNHNNQDDSFNSDNGGVDLSSDDIEDSNSDFNTPNEDGSLNNSSNNDDTTPSSIIKETKEELSKLENSKKVKSTINKFTKLSNNIEEKLDWTLATCTLSPARSSHSVTVYGSSLILIGGEGVDDPLNLVQFVDVERNIFTTPKVTGGKFGPESIHSHDYCRIGNKFYLFGGLVGNKISNKLYIVTIIDDSTVHWSQARINGQLIPSPRYGHTFTRYGNKFILFGGNDGSNCLNDLYILDPETMLWQLIKSNNNIDNNGNIPSTVSSSSSTPSTTSPPQQPPILIPPPSAMNTTTTNTTINLTTTNGILPQERYGHTSTILGEKLIIYGGINSKGKELSDLHVLQLDSFTWTNVNTHHLEEVPPERAFHSATRIGRNMVIVGGKKEGTTLRDVWILSYRMQWSKVSGIQISPRSHHGLIKNGTKLFVLGGKGSNGNVLDDIWFVNTVALPISSNVTMINYPDVKVEKEIGKGHFSKVLRGMWKGKEVAIKKLNIGKDKDKEEMMNEFKAEVELLGSLQHPNLVTCYGYTINPMCILMEYLPTGNLFDLIHSREQKLDSALILQFAFDIARGMQHLHTRNIIHRDLKSSNLLLDKHFNIKIADLGIARETSFTQTMTTIGTVAWTAPEILRHESYNQKADVYSFGIVIWELLTGQEPYEGIPPMNAGILVASKELRPELPENCDANWKKLVVWCWTEDPNKRPSFEEITNYLTKTF
ncbi:hypothetical protein CYY_004760 [Polysphondylium violaceum]|uniref:Protein kinase domain-containing protein n=1 Tax=Polysphondylium violaceum TaxID=133409 RepID=A0A8J4USR7_9MYCE|nr:hypothetical protein CYY_004760 [Polysphondylium violaceum]